MPMQTNAVEYKTYTIGAGYLVKRILDQLDVVSAIDQNLRYQPEIGTTYGTLAQVIIINRMTFDPQPLYHVAEWAEQRGISRLLGIQSAWLDDDRLGAMLDGLADHQAEIWRAIVGKGIKKYQVELEWLHSDTTSVYFEGVYEDEKGQPKQEANGPLLIEGYNKDGQRQKGQFVLSLAACHRIPIWYTAWNGNQSDDGVYLADMNALRQAGWVPDNVVMIGDRKLCNRETMVSFCRTNQFFLAAHPWTDTAKDVWRRTKQRLQRGELSWIPVDYVTRNETRKPIEKRTQYKVCEVGHELPDRKVNQVYSLRWVFSWSSSKAELDTRQRNKALEAGEAALQRIAKLLGKYDYTSRKTIEHRIEKALSKAKAKRYFQYTLCGTDDNQTWVLTWQQCQDVIADEQLSDGVALLCTNVAPERLSAGEVMIKYKEQVSVEQTIDFIKSPVYIRPMWLHSPRRLAGLALLIMIAVLVASLLEYHVRRHIAQTGQRLRGLMPENRDNNYPTARKLLQAFQDYTIVVVRSADGQETVHWPKLRSIQQQICTILGLGTVPETLNSG